MMAQWQGLPAVPQLFAEAFLNQPAGLSLVTPATTFGSILAETAAAAAARAGAAAAGFVRNAPGRGMAVVDGKGPVAEAAVLSGLRSGPVVSIAAARAESRLGTWT